VTSVPSNVRNCAETPDHLRSEISFLRACNIEIWYCIYIQWRSQNEAKEAMAHPETNLLRFSRVLYINWIFNCLKISGRNSRIHDDVIDWPFPNKIIGCATVYIA